MRTLGGNEPSDHEQHKRQCGKSEQGDKLPKNRRVRNTLRSGVGVEKLETVAAGPALGEMGEEDCPISTFEGFAG